MMILGMDVRSLMAAAGVTLLISHWLLNNKGLLVGLEITLILGSLFTLFNVASLSYLFFLAIMQ